MIVCLTITTWRGIVGATHYYGKLREYDGEWPEEELRVKHPLTAEQAAFINKQDGMDLVTSTRLVEWLDHHNIAVRELAFFHVKRLTGITYDYHPLRPPLQRSSAINRWQERIKNDGGLIARPKTVN